MFLSDQQKSNIQGLTNSLLNSLKAMKTCYFPLFFFDRLINFLLVSLCFYDYYTSLPIYTEENREIYEFEKSKVFIECF